jgi:hypothetical protein
MMFQLSGIGMCFVGRLSGLLSSSTRSKPTTYKKNHPYPQTEEQASNDKRKSEVPKTYLLKEHMELRMRARVNRNFK